jgi:2-oxoglutarate ferredoxin oxidoreductase subunit beta
VRWRSSSGASFVARSFSATRSSCCRCCKAALATPRHGDDRRAVSPASTFNDHEGSTKSYAYVKDHDERLEE